MKDKKLREEVKALKKEIRDAKIVLDIFAEELNYSPIGYYSYVEPLVSKSHFAYKELKVSEKDFHSLLDYLGLEIFEGREIRKKKTVQK